MVFSRTAWAGSSTPQPLHRGLGLPPRRRAWGRCRPAPAGPVPLQRGPVQGAAALQQHAVDLLRPRRSIRAAGPHGRPARQVPHPASGGLVGRRPLRQGRQVARMVGTSRAVRTIRLSSGVRRWVSQMTRDGVSPPSIRQVSRGSSASTVPTPPGWPGSGGGPDGPAAGPPPR